MVNEGGFARANTSNEKQDLVLKMTTLRQFPRKLSRSRGVFECLCLLGDMPICPGFPIWLWYFCPFDQSSSLDFRGFLERNQATEGDTQWVNYKRSPFSSRSTDF